MGQVDWTELYEAELSRLQEDCPSERQESCELGQSCECRRKARDYVEDERGLAYTEARYEGDA